MDQLFLSRIYLTQFRSFEKLEIEMEPDPGVLIVHGSNGLGKSSLFDALEWALTDEIDHFRKVKGVDKVGSYLCRWRKGDPGPTIASMTFSDGEDITRSLSNARARTSKLDGSITNVTNYLRSPDWAQRISALNRYLLLTHFLGQSTVSRLTHRTADERFDILKEAAQSSAVEAIADRLHGKGNTTAVRAFARQADAADSEAKTLRSLLEQEAQFFEATQVSGALDDSEGLEIASQIAGLLTDLLPPAERPDLGQELDAAMVDTLQVALESAQEAGRQQQVRLDRARQLVREGRDHAAALAAADASLNEVDKQLAKLGVELASAEAQVATRAELVETRRTALGVARSRHAQLLELRMQFEQVAAKRADRGAAEAARKAAEQAYSDAETALAKVERRQNIVDRLTADIGQADAELAALREAAGSIDEAIAGSTRIDQLRQELDALESGNANIEMAVADAARAAQAAKEAEADQLRLVNELEQTVSAISDAISTIAANLSEQSCDCPVCATHFKQPGVLHTRASAAAERLAPSLLTQQQALGEAVRRREDTAVRHAALVGVQAQISSLRDQLAEEGNQQKVRLELISSRISVVASANLASNRNAVEEAIRALLTRRSRRIRWRDFLARQEGVAFSARLPQERRRLDDARRARDAAQRAVVDLSTSLDGADKQAELLTRTLFGAAKPDDGALAKAIDDAEGALSEAQVHHDEAMGQALEAEAQLAALKTSKAAADARKSQLEASRTTVLEAVEGVHQQWTALGFDGANPDEAGLTGAAATATQASDRIREAEDQLRRLRTGREAWARQQSYRGVHEELRTLMDSPQHSDREQLRTAARQRAEEKQRLADRTRAARDIARSATVDIYASLEQFNADYIRPLDVLTKTINRAILCDPRVGIDLHVRARKIEQSATKAAGIPESVGEIDPALVHSEGQMAALAVSMLCAASLTFPWSRWRALVLDDPLQHNDTIHAAAFADMVGNLVHEQGYQVFLTTHDLSQAQFLQRKFDARHVPCAALQLLGEGRNGVDTEFRPARIRSPVAAAG